MTKRTCQGDAYWNMWEDNFIEIIERTNNGNKDKVVFKEFIHSLIEKERESKPLVIGNEIECRNCKSIMLMTGKLNEFHFYEHRRCERCGQVIDWTEIRTLKENNKEMYKDFIKNKLEEDNEQR